MQELTQNPRLRFGLWAILALLLVYAIDILGNRIAAERAAHADLRERLAGVEAVAEQTEWFQRAESSRAVRVQMESRLWRSTSRGLAQATLQSWLERQATNLRVENPRISLLPVEDYGSAVPLWKVSATVSGTFASQRFYQFLGNIARSNELLRVDELTINNAGRRAAFQMTVTAWFYSSAEQG